MLRTTWANNGPTGKGDPAQVSGPIPLSPIRKESRVSSTFYLPIIRIRIIKHQVNTTKSDRTRVGMHVDQRFHPLSFIPLGVYEKEVTSCL